MIRVQENNNKTTTNVQVMNEPSEGNMEVTLHEPLRFSPSRDSKHMNLHHEASSLGLHQQFGN